VRLAVAEDVDLVLLNAPAEPLADGSVAAILERAPCDVALVVDGEAQGGRVLVPFVGSGHDWAAIELGAWLARSNGEPLVIGGPTEGEAGRDASRLLASASLAVQR